MQWQRVGDSDWSQWSLTLEVRKSNFLSLVLEQGYTMSQWSLTLEVRKRRSHWTAVRAATPVAMEPDLGGQEKRRGVRGARQVETSQWSLTLEVRKRA